MSNGRKLLIGLFGLLLNCALLGPQRLQSAWTGTWGDFLHFYVGARLAPHHAEYDIEQGLQLQKDVAGTTRPLLQRNRFPFYYELISPLGRLSYARAHRVWFVLLVAAAIGAATFYPISDRFALIAAYAASFPLLLSFCLGQDVSFLAVILAAGVLLYARKHNFVAGLVLALLSIKFHLFLLLPLLFWSRRDYRTLAGGLTGGITLMAANFLFYGRNWIADLVRVIRSPVGDTAADVMPNLRGLDAVLGGTGAAEVVLGVVVVIATWYAIRRSNFEIGLAAALLGSFLLSHHSYVQDTAILIPGFVVLVSWNIPIASGLALGCLVPAVYLLQLTPRVGWVAPLLILATLLSLAWTAPHKDARPST